MITPNRMAWVFLSEVPIHPWNWVQNFKLKLNSSSLEQNQNGSLGHYRPPSFTAGSRPWLSLQKFVETFLDPNGWKKDPDAELKNIGGFIFTQPWLQCRYLVLNLVVDESFKDSQK